MDRNCLQASDPRFVGDPVDTFTGAVLDRQLDFRLAGPLPLQWWRRYDSSRANQLFSLGWGNVHEFDVRLIFDIDGIRFADTFGVISDFPPLESDGASYSGAGKTLTRINSRTYQLHEHSLPVREFVFGPKNTVCKPSRIFDSRGEIQFSYDSQYNLCGLVDSLGRAIEITLDRRGIIQEVAFQQVAQRERRVLAAYSYDQHDNLIGVRNQFDHAFSMQYDSFHRLTRRIDRNGYAFEFEYDARGYCVKTAGEDGVLENRIAYVVPGETTEVTRGNGGRWRYHYQLGRLAQIDDPLGGQEKFVYDDQGTSLQDIDTNGNVTTAIYDDTGALIGKRSPLGFVSARPVDLNEPDPLAHRVAQNAAEYEFGRLVNLQAISTAKPTEPPAASELNERPATYFEQANLYSTPALGFVVGRKWWPEPSSGRQFDLTGDLIHQIDRHGRKRRWMYDGNGNVVKYVDFDGGVWSYEYGSWNHLLSETNPLGYSNTMEYDSQENLTLFQDSGGTRSEYAYDLKDALVEVRRHGQLRERYERDSAGNLTAKYAADGRLLLKLEYGEGNLLKKRILASGDEHTYEYDASGRVLKAATKSDALEFKYDALGNRILEKRNGLGIEQEFRGWRALGKVTFLNKFAVRYEVDSNGALVITDPCGGRQRISFSPNGTIEKTLSNNSSETVVFDEVGRCQSKTYRRAGGNSWSRKYVWSGEGELRKVEDSISGATTYGYDAAHRLIKRSRYNVATDEFQFDANNNLIKQPGLSSVILREGNRLVSTTSEVFEHNDRNHISKRTSVVGATEYFYDSYDQLVKAVTPAGVWTADYDTEGRRIRKTFNSRTTEYYWSSDQLAAEISPDGEVRLYVYTDAMAMMPFMFIDYASLDSDPASGKRYFIVSDQIGTPVGVLDDGGNDVWRASIDPFGSARISVSLVQFDLRFCGHFWDADLGLNYNRYRNFDPSLGRYLESDPLGITGGANLYAYAVNPLSFVDLFGLSCRWCVKNNHKGKCPKEHEETEIVYVHVDKDGKVVYIGITNDPQRRAQEHAKSVQAGDKSGVTMIVVSDKLSHADARNVESLAIRARLDASKVDTSQSIESQLSQAGLDNANRGRTDDRRAESPGSGAGVSDTRITGEAYDLTNGGARI